MTTSTPTKLTLKQWHPSQQPREKLLQQGAHSLSDAELLALFLRTGIPGKTAIDLATDLLNDFGGLHALLNASRERLCEAKGMGDAKYAQLQAVLEMAKRCLWEELRQTDSIHSPQQSRQFLHAQLSQEPREVFAILYLTSQHQVLSFEKLFYGTLTSASVYPREVIRRCLELGAAAIIIAHNHPSGIATASQADRDLTAQLQQALQWVDIQLLDHIIIGRGTYTSFAERGWL